MLKAFLSLDTILKNVHDNKITFSNVLVFRSAQRFSTKGNRKAKYIGLNNHSLLKKKKKRRKEKEKKISLLASTPDTNHWPCCNDTRRFNDISAVLYRKKWPP